MKPIRLPRVQSHFALNAGCTASGSLLGTDGLGDFEDFPLAASDDLALLPDWPGGNIGGSRDGDFTTLHSAHQLGRAVLLNFPRPRNSAFADVEQFRAQLADPRCAGYRPALALPAWPPPLHAAIRRDAGAADLG